MQGQAFPAALTIQLLAIPGRKRGRDECPCRRCAGAKRGRGAAASWWSSGAASPNGLSACSRQGSTTSVLDQMLDMLDLPVEQQQQLEEDEEVSEFEEEEQQQPGEWEPAQPYQPVMLGGQLWGLPAEQQEEEEEEESEYEEEYEEEPAEWEPAQLFYQPAMLGGGQLWGPAGGSPPPACFPGQYQPSCAPPSMLAPLAVSLPAFSPAGSGPDGMGSMTAPATAFVVQLASPGAVAFPRAPAAFAPPPAALSWGPPQQQAWPSACRCPGCLAAAGLVPAAAHVLALERASALAAALVQEQAANLQLRRELEVRGHDGVAQGLPACPPECLLPARMAACLPARPGGWLTAGWVAPVLALQPTTAAASRNACPAPSALQSLAHL